MIKTNETHVSFDLETMGTKPDSAIVAIGAVMFNLTNKEDIKPISTFYTELDWRGQERWKDPDTKAWWKKQSAEARKCLTGIAVLSDALNELSNWLGQTFDDKYLVWGNGSIFDIAILENAYDMEGEDIPWKFWNIRDVRTAKGFLDMLIGHHGGAFKGIVHNALDDAIHQANIINRSYRIISSIAT